MTTMVPLFVALMAWWIGTGVILLAVRRSDVAGGGSLGLVLAGLPFLVFGLVGVPTAAADATVWGIYGGFFAALCIWGWIELSFMSGIITGPNHDPLPEGTTGWPRVWAAWWAVAWHELLLLAALVYVFAASQGSLNVMAPWTFGVLYAARVLAKLNLFLGVPGINLEAVPGTLSHIPSYFRQGTPSALFPFTIIVLSLATALWASRLAAAVSPEEMVTFGLLAALTGLALIEHWMMLLPTADTKLWRWLMPARPAPKQTPQEQG
ncbi:MAG: putative photosynthetic complex assembly protein PuhE [Rhodobacteraceae bacterium]|nr:putative photosynthetic complex assembly protein PuhE [Paracoccaceae bacterium]